MHETPLTERTDTEQRVFFFGDGACEGDPERKDVLGGKGASLADMSRAGLPVPPGFTISVQCCEEYHATGGWPVGLEDEVRAYMARLERSTGRAYGRGQSPLLVSVRSGAARSMPGMMDTILNCGLHPGLADEVEDVAHFWSVYEQFVRQFGNTVADIPMAAFDEAAEDAHAAHLKERAAAEACIALYEERTGKSFPVDPWDALRECIDAVFESWNNERARVYRKVHGLEHLTGTAVNVQSMFNSEVSGIAFTANPAAPTAQEIVIESAYGLGESIVSGNVTPDRFVLDSQTLEIKDEALGKKEHVMSGLSRTAGAEPDAEAASLTPEQVQVVGRIALRVEEYFGFPVDIEWGLADGSFSLLQSRPIRGLDVARDVEAGRREEIVRLKDLASQGGKVWIVHNLSETLEAPTPLTWDIIRDFMSGDGGFGRMYRDFGYRPSDRVCEDGFLELICGRIYVDVDRASELFWRGMPLKYDHEEVLDDPRILESAPMHFEAGEADAAFLLRLPGTLVSMFRSMRRMKSARKEAITRFEEELTDFLEYVAGERERDLSTMSPEDLIDCLHGRVERVLTDFGKESLKPGFFGGLARAELEAKLVQLMGREQGQMLCGTLTSGLEGDSTMEQNAMLFRVAKGEETMHAFLSLYGHRAVGEMELSRPRWREDDAYLRTVVENQAISEEHSPAHLHRRNRERREQAMRDLPAMLAEWGGSFLSEHILHLAREAQALLPYRETGKNYLLMGYELLRDVIRELGGRWGIGSDAFFLQLHELPEFDSDRERLEEAARERKVRWQAFQRLDLPDVIDSEDLDDLGLPRQIEAAREMEALSLSPGVVTGTVRIVFDPLEARDLGDDCILVCPSTDPSWTALFTTIKGLVVERGGVLSHGAITARDFSIPAVACPDATAMIADGARVRVDGDRGHISVIRD